MTRVNTSKVAIPQEIVEQPGEAKGTPKVAPVALPTGAAQPDAIAQAPEAREIAAPARADVRGSGSAALRFETEAKLDKKHNTPEVEKLLLSYLGDGTKPVSRPQERILGWVAYVDAKLKEGKTTDEVLDIAVRDDLRRRVFLLEGLFKLYRGEISKDLDGQFDVSKAFEDVLGKYTYARSMTKAATDNGAPQPVIAELQKCEAQAREDALGFLRDWMPNDKGKIPGIKRMIQAVRKGDFGKYKDDREYLQKKIAKEIKEIDEGEFDMQDLEGGLHELRRQLRWIPVYCESTAGLVQLDEKKNPVDAYASLLGGQVATSKYVVLPPADREKNPLFVSKSLYSANMDYVLKLGAIKDKGEAIHGMERAFTAAGVAKTPKEAHEAALALLKLDASAADFSAEGEKIYAEMRQHGLLSALRHDIKEQ